ncbi:MAG: sigma-70 family RNA polymerase sigma factor [Acidobacteriaceae bacterium]|nr:sigma-70 family RNA polymerase sigma factor [Acidobacteriaceae bacterium]
MTPLTDLLDSHRSRLHEEVERVYEETRTAICSYLLHLGVPAAQAQEVTQDVYLRLYQTLRKGQGIENLRAWLFRVAHHQGVKVRSREKSFRMIDPDWNRFLQPAAESPERQLLDRERMKRIVKAMGELSPQQRNCLYLRSEGLRYREIAEVMGISLSTVNEFLRRGVTRLAEAVHE